MKKNIVKAAVVLILSLVTLSLTGCTDGEAHYVSSMLGEHPDGNTKISLCIAGGSHSNEYEIPLNSDSMSQYIYDTCYTNGEISIISSGSNPTVVYQTNIPDPEVGGLSEEKLHTIASQYASEIQGVLSQASAQTPEVDTLKSIQMGARCLAGADSDTTDKVLLVLDTGLSTTGYLDFTKGLLNADEGDIVEALRGENAIPDLENVLVIWSFLGDVAAPQEPLTPRQVEKLANIWEAVIEAGNGHVVFSKDAPGNNACEGLPPVSVVDVPDEEINVEISADEEPPTIVIEQPIETVVLDNSKVQFIGDKAIFVNEEEALEEIKNVAVQLIEHPNNTVYVVGTTASGDANFTQTLSEDRANAVAEVLISLGIEEDRLTVLGLGCYDPWHETDNEGGWDESKAELNRKVLIIDTTHEDAKKVVPYLN